MRLNYLIMRQGHHNYERAAHGAERGVAAINGREGKRDRRDGGGMAEGRLGERTRPADRGWSDRVINIQSTPDRANNFLPSST